MPEPTTYHNRLAGMTVVVTGAGSRGDGVGTGKAIALLFAREGARLILVDIDRPNAEETRAQIEESGGEALVVEGNVTREEDCARIAAATIEWGGSIDVLVNNVGLGASAGRLEDTAVAAWREDVALNFDSALLMTRACIPHLLTGNGKSIVNIASIAGLRAHGSFAYGPAKAAMIHLTRELAVTYGGEGIRANSIAPGHIMTPLVERFSSPGARETRRRIAPLSVEGDAWDVAQAALFLAGPESRFITGVCLPVDGGVAEIGALAAYEAISGESMTR